MNIKYEATKPVGSSFGSLKNGDVFTFASPGAVKGAMIKMDGAESRLGVKCNTVALQGGSWYCSSESEKVVKYPDATLNMGEPS